MSDASKAGGGWYSGWNKLATSIGAAAVPGSAGAAQREQQQNAEAHITALQTENRRLTEAAAKLELEKSLLKDLVDRAYSGDGGDAEGFLRWQPAKAELLEQLRLAKEAADAAERRAAKDAKRAAVFEAELLRVQEELKQNDLQVATFRRFNADHEAVLRKLEAEAAARVAAEVTVASLMETISSIDAKASRTGTAAMPNGDGTEVVTRERDDLRAEVAALRERLAEVTAEQPNGADAAAAADHARTQELEAEILVLDSRIRQLEATVAAQQAQVLGAEEECVALQAAMDANDAACAELKDAAAAAVDARGAAEAELAAVSQKLVSVQATLAEAKSEIMSLCAQRDALETTITGIRAELEVLHNVMDTKDREIRSGQVAFASERAQWVVERAGLQAQIDELKDKIVEAETNAAIKIRMANVKVKELQAQLAATVKAHETAVAAAVDAGGGFAAVVVGATAGVPGSGPVPLGTATSLHEENLALIDRIAAAQEQVWSLQTAKKTYEEEIKRLNDKLRFKTDVVRQHFEDAAIRSAQDRLGHKDTSGGSGGGVAGYLYAAANIVTLGHVGSTAQPAPTVVSSDVHQIDVIDAMQTKMESVLAENVRVRQEMARVRAEQAKLREENTSMQASLALFARRSTIDPARLGAAAGTSNTARRSAYKPGSSPGSPKEAQPAPASSGSTNSNNHSGGDARPTGGSFSSDPAAALATPRSSTDTPRADADAGSLEQDRLHRPFE